jgi:hypothetical protein
MCPAGNPATAASTDNFADEGDMGKAGSRMRASDIGLVGERGAPPGTDPASRQAAVVADHAERRGTVSANSANLPPCHA